MKFYLFIDNFRGFSDTCIPLTTVNFLVGENSTGKTSVLGLLKMLSGPDFLFDADLRDEDVGFRHFSDMVSAHSKDQTYFRIGFVSEPSGKSGRVKSGGKMVTGFLLTFVQAEGLPRLFKYTFCRGAHTVTLRFRKDAVHYKESKIKTHLTAERIVAALRTEWVREHASGNRGYRKLMVPAEFSGKIPILLALSLIMGRSDHSRAKKKKKRHELVVYPPYAAFPPELAWLAPIRSKPARTYDELTVEFSPEGKHTPNIIRRMLRSKKEGFKFRHFIKRVGRESRLFQDVRTRNFGSGATAPFELDIILDGKALNVTNVGYGVSQSLPVFVEMLARPHGTWFAIQQPEVHLHPRAQATLGDVLFELAAIDHKFFFVETHSDFTIDRFRMNYRKRRSDKPDSQVLFFERQERHNVVTVLRISKAGDLPTKQPQGYRDFFIKEDLRLLGI